MTAAQLDVVISFDGGATSTSVMWEEAKTGNLGTFSLGPGNVLLLSDSELASIFDLTATKLGTNYNVVAVGAFFAGAANETQVKRLEFAISSQWPNAVYRVGSDALAAEATAFPDPSGNFSHTGATVICGTGSICRIRAGDPDRVVTTGGGGHVAGDSGSCYWLGKEYLRAAFEEFDANGTPGLLCQSLIAYIGVENFGEVTFWSTTATKQAIADLSIVAFRMANDVNKDDERTRTCQHIAQQIIQTMVENLARCIHNGVKRTFTDRQRAGSFEVALVSQVATKQPLLFKLFTSAVQQQIPNAKVRLVTEEAIAGALALAKSEWKKQSPAEQPPIVSKQVRGVTNRGLANSITEQRNPRSNGLHKKTVPELVELMLSEEAGTVPAIQKEMSSISAATQEIASRMRAGGHLFYIGAGTSGRLGVLDAAECPPTFSTPPHLVQGIIAGGPPALLRSREGMEDDANEGRAVVYARGITSKDSLVGIAASGSTPYVLGAMRAAHELGANVVFVTLNPKATFSLGDSRFFRIAIDAGPEVLTGSTRLKAGTATKIVLNIFSTVSMIQLGKVVDNLMIDLHPSCEKLRDRATRIVCSLTQKEYDEVWSLLEKYHWEVKRMLDSEGYGSCANEV